MRGAGRDGHGAGCRDGAIGGRSLGGKEVGRDEGDDGRHDQGGAHPLQERPTDDQNREVGGEGCRQTAGTVDDEADCEGPASAQDRAQLSAGEHEGRHHERVERNGGLDSGDGRAEVVCDRRHRYVHNG